MSGGSGSDEIFPGGGDDAVSGDEGDDLILAVDTTGVDTVECGDGDDRGFADPVDIVAVDCEGIGDERACPRSAALCEGTATLTIGSPPSRAIALRPARATGAVLLGSKDFRLRGGVKKLVAVKLARKGKRIVTQRGRVRVKAVVKTRIKLRSGKTKKQVERSKIVLVKATP